MIAAVHFRNFKALRSTALRLEQFNLLLGPSGSGKTSLIQALLQLRTLSALPAAPAPEAGKGPPAGSEIEFHFTPPYQDLRVTLGCPPEVFACRLLAVAHPPGPAGAAQWDELRTRLQSIRAYLFDHYAMALPAARPGGPGVPELASNGGNLAAVLAGWSESHSAEFAALVAEFGRLAPEFAGVEFRPRQDGRVELFVRLAGPEGELIPASGLSQGTLYLLALLTLSLAPAPPRVVCLEEADRGFHPRMLREVRDALYRLSYPRDFGLARAPVQVIATTHSPYLLDQFREHPEEIVLAHKRGRDATFERLSERTDLKGLLGEAHLGDLWYSGILGGVPEE